MSNNARPVAVVTGSSRGAGAGIARALGGAGYAVYVTGRTVEEGGSAASRHHRRRPRSRGCGRPPRRRGGQGAVRADRTRRHGPAYGAQKAGVDKFAADIGVDLKNDDVAAISIWMGPLKTERTAKAIKERPDQYGEIMGNAETPEFTWRLIAAVHKDPERMTLSGQTLIGAELAERYGITEAEGRRPPSFREMLGAPRILHPAIVR
jgi:NAD(P)-dependent dehydrogenase (short-subunit alcohol dehydrogenase family)